MAPKHGIDTTKDASVSDNGPDSSGGFFSDLNTS